MEYVPYIIAILALLVAGFTFYKASGLVLRIQNLEKKNRELEAGVKSLENHIRRNSKNQQPENQRNLRGGQPNQPQGREPRQSQEPRQPQEPRQKQPQQGRGQQPQAEQTRGNQQQPRQPQEPRQKQEGPQQQRPPREPREPREPKEQRQPQEPRQKQPQQQPIQPAVTGGTQPQRTQQQPQQRRNENRRREPLAPLEVEGPSALQPAPIATLGSEIVGDDLLNELTQQVTPQAAPQPEAPVSRTRYSIIPEDGTIKTHQLQQRPDSDSYLEIDAPAEGSSSTSYRFNLGGNQAFVISQGMDRLENAFSFEKPSNRLVSRIVLQGDGVLVRTSSGWKIQEKAKIDFR